ncbi:MAG: PAS domain S-box protein [Candidatus Cyclobacteriaceae bacterium M2_1C_046]
MTNNFILKSLKDQLYDEQKEKQDLEDLVIRQQDEIRELKNRLNYQYAKESSPIQNIESFLNKDSSLQDDDILTALKERNDFIQLVLDTSPNFLCVRDAEGTIKLVNKAFANILFNEEKEKIKKVKVSDFYTKAEEKEYFFSTENLVLEKRYEVKIQESFTDRTGKTSILQTIKKPLITANGEIFVLGISTDITEQVQAKEKLQHQEELFRLLSENSSDIISLYDVNFNGIYISPACLDILGYEPERFIKMDLKEVIHPEDQENLFSSIEQNAINSPEENVSIQYRCRKKDGEYIWLESNVENIMDENGKIIRYQASTRDISDRKEAQHALKQSIKLRENFLANMSHEIRTPMQGIIGMSDLLSKTPLNSQQKDHLKLIRQSANNLLVIINDILDYSKIKEGKLEIEKIAFDINEVLQSAHKMLEMKADDKGLIFHTSPVRIKSPLIGDPYRLNQILLNLVNNAIKFTEEGSITISGKVVKETKEETTIEFYIEDTGIGIAKENQEKIFEEFSQASSYTTRKFGGTGLGLNISKNLIDIQNGQLWVESQVGVGSKFSFSLPFKKADIVDPSIDQENDNIDFNCLKKVNVLLAEDNQVNIIIAETYMARWGFTIDVATNGREAVAMAEKNSYDIILMDIQMPALSGADATKLIRKFKDEKKAGVPIIALTANVFKQDIKNYLESGMNDYLSKPFTEKELFLKIAKQFSINPRQSDVIHAQDQEIVVSDETTIEAAVIFKSTLQECNLSYLISLTDGDRIFMKEMINLFLAQASEELEIISKSIENNDLDQVKKYAHKLKSSTGMVGANRMSELLREMENMQQNKKDCKQLFIQIKANYDQVMDELDHILLEI